MGRKRPGAVLLGLAAAAVVLWLAFWRPVPGKRLVEQLPGEDAVRVTVRETLEDGETVRFGSLTVKSKSLGKNLRGCDKIVLFGATLGIGVDQLLSRTSKTDMAKTVVLQACAAALLEEYCDECQDRIRQEMESEGRYLRPRFSPGYGDFPIECQRDLVRMLDCAKSIGLTLTESCMMAPSKSVTAVIGAGRAAVRCHRQGCESCEKIDCIYRRDTL